MDLIRKKIKKEIKRLAEGKNLRKFKAPSVVVNALKELFPGPIVRYVENLKAANTVPPSYRVFLREGGKHFDLVLEQVSVVVKIGPKTFWMMNKDETLEATKELDRLLRAPVLNVKGDEETNTDSDTDSSSSDDTAFEEEPEPETEPES